MNSVVSPPHMRFEATGYRVQARLSGVVVADSERAITLYEGRLPPVVYFPREDVRMDLAQASTHTTFCPFKGNARYWSLLVGDRRAENVMWSYEQPYAEADPIASHVAFYVEALDGWSEAGREVDVHGQAVEGPYANPLLSWLLGEAPFIDSPAALTAALANKLVEADFKLMRLNVVIRTLHPQRVGHAYRWHQDEPEDIETFVLTYELLQTEGYRNSPFVPIYDGAAGIRRRLDIPDPVLDYPILVELHEAGASDYVAMPLVFSDGAVHAVTFCTDRPGGFTTRQLGHLYEVLAVLARIYEVHARRSTSLNVLDTYLGRLSGERVLEGHIRRGDADDIEAIIWFCDLRESTPLARSMSRREFLALLNAFFDAVGGPVLANGGEVLRFIGDAALAIFPVDATGAPAALDRALAAVNGALEAMETLNQERIEADQVPLSFGIGLHDGAVTYGNIGTRDRLEFTVVGEAANYAARVESQCRETGEVVLVSETVARMRPSRFRPVGQFALKGVAGDHTLFALRAPPSAG